MKGYKAFNSDFTCANNFQYEVGKSYEMEEDPKLCKRGFHFCKELADCFDYYSFNKANTRIAEVVAYGKIDETIIPKWLKKDSKLCTNKIKIVREIPWEEIVKIVNDGEGNFGIKNIGDGNAGNCNFGNFNLGHNNTGSGNTGNYNVGDFNSGGRNVGKYNAGYGNTGNLNAGDGNHGDCNTGHFNFGNYNTGDFNAGHGNTGCFCTEDDYDRKILLFDKPSKMTFTQWRESRACKILSNMPHWSTEWVEDSQMTDKEKEIYDYKLRQGILKHGMDIKKERQEWWNGLFYIEKECILDLPNFDAEKFKKCTGIDVNISRKEQNE